MKNINTVTQTKHKNIKLIITVGNEAPAPPLIPSAVVPMPQSSAKYLKNNIKTYVTISTRSLRSVMNFAKAEYHTTTLLYQLNDTRDNKEIQIPYMNTKTLHVFPRIFWI